MQEKTLISELVGITTFNEGKFYILVDGVRYTCLLENKENWDKLYDHLGHRPLIVKYSGTVGPDNTISVRI